MTIKRFVSTVLASFALIFGLSTSVVFAVEDRVSQTNTTRTTSTEVKTTNQTAQATTLSDADKQKLLQRLTERKTNLKTKLTNAQKVRLQTKCKAAQGLMAPIKSKVTGYEQGRGEVYSKVVTRLKDVSIKVKAKGISTTELDAAITTLEGKVTTFNTDIAIYKQAVSDLTDMECTTDPEAFQASLQEARSALEKVKSDATDIRSYVKDTIKPILLTIKGQLQPKKTTES